MKYQEMDPKFSRFMDRVCFGLGGAGICLIIQLFSGLGQDVPGTGGLTRYQVAEMLVDCDRGKHEGYCVADVNIRPRDAQ
jgi:hypothetical protein